MEIRREIVSPITRRMALARERFSALQRQAIVKQIQDKTATLQIDGDTDATNAEVQQGRQLHVSVVIQRLRLMNSTLHFEVSKNDDTKMGIYVIQSDGVRFICGMENGWMPEFTVVQAEETRIPDPDVDLHWQTVKEYGSETRGWRNVLFRLIQSKLITEPQAEKYFGVSKGRSSKKWKGLFN